MNRAQAMLARFDLAEYRLCRGLNRGALWPGLNPLMRGVSRLGNGLFWYALLLFLPVRYGAAAVRPVLLMAASGLVGLLIYKALKRTLVRERPFIRHAGITLVGVPLDRYSFPSGHTLHAVCFTWQAVAHFPQLAWLLVPMAALIGASRVVLGLHYPSDVLAGAGIGALLAGGALALG